MNRPRGRALSVIVASGALLALLSVCAVGSYAPWAKALTASNAGPRPGAMPRGNFTPPLVFLPLDRFRFSSAEELLITKAERTLSISCLAARGPQPARSQHADTQGLGNRHDRRYGLLDPQLARAYGYHLAGPNPRRTPQAPPGQRRADEGLCLTEARHALGLQETREEDLELLARLDLESWSRAQDDVDVRTEMQAWSGCMRTAGYMYKDPFAASNDPRFSGDVATPLEIIVASRDVDCKRTTDLVSTWYAADRRYQDAVLATPQPQLDALDAAQQRQLAQARSVLGAAAGGHAASP